MILPLAAVALPASAWAAPAGADAAAMERPAAPPPARANTVCCPTPAADPCCVRGVRWQLTVGLWVWGVDGTIGDNGRQVDVDLSWTDTLGLIDKLEFAFDGRLRAEWSKWRFYVGVDGATLGDSGKGKEGRLTVDVEKNLWTGYATLGYVVAGGRMGCDACAGLRYYGTSIDIASTGLAAPNAVNSSDQWVDPIVGLHLAVESRRWLFVVEGDVGGVGVGSEFAWSALASVGCSFSRGFATSMGWRVLDLDREPDAYLFDVALSGPFLAFTFSS